jgi:hypothetical protein
LLAPPHVELTDRSGRHFDIERIDNPDGGGESMELS